MVHQWGILLGVVAWLASCSAPSTTTPQGQSSVAQSISEQPITIDGSSTVYPLTDEVTEEYQFEYDNAPEIIVNFSGTTGGFRKFCAGEIDISNASRPIVKDEMEACKAAGIEYIELPVAYDALTVVVHPDNTWAESITVEELKTIWEPAAEGKVTSWNQIRSDFPDRPMNLYGAGQDSGTFDYFTEAIVGEAKASRNDYTASEDDTELVRGIRKEPEALGYFGYAYYEENQRTLKALAIDNGNGPVMPSADTVRSGEYQPLARPLFIYVNAKAVQTKPELRPFVEYYLNNARFLTEVVGYVPLPDEAYNIAVEHLMNNKIGTVFEGQQQTNLTIEELLQKEATY